MKTVKFFSVIAAGALAGTLLVNASEGERRGKGEHSRPKNAAEMIEKLDQDGDGVLNEEELQVLCDRLSKFKDKMKGRMGKRGPKGEHGKRGPHGPGDKLKEADVDGDGKVSRDEMLDKVSKKFDEMDVDGDGYVTEAEVKEQMKAKMFARADKDGDGVVSEDEFRGPKEIFEKIDADESGDLTQEELEAAHEKRRAERKEKCGE